MVTLHDRRDYWESVNGKSVELEDRNGVITVPNGEPATQAELEVIPEQDVEDYLDGRAAAAQEVLTKKEIADLKHASPDALDLLGKDNNWISDNIEAITAGSSNTEIVAGIREALKRSDRINRDVLNALKAMVK